MNFGKQCKFSDKFLHVYSFTSFQQLTSIASGLSDGLSNRKVGTLQLLWFDLLCDIKEGNCNLGKQMK